MESNKPVSQKITEARIKSLMQENRELKRKVANNRIAVCTLNEIALMYTDFLCLTIGLLSDNQIPQTPDVKRMITKIRNYANENYGMEMENRILSIINDSTGDDVLLDDLFNPPQEKTDE